MKTEYSTAIIGAGPAGLAAACRLIEKGMSDFILIERDTVTGGILNQCIHNGFGLEFYREDLTGPEFARRQESRLTELISALPDEKQPVILCSTMATSVEKLEEGYKIFAASSLHGTIGIEAEAVITTTGCRERTRGNIEIPGARPAGIFTAGQAQNLINRRHYSIGDSIVIQGSGDIGLIMARRLSLEGYRVKAVLERLPYLSGLIRNKVQCLDHFDIPLYLGRQITDIRGRNRVTSVRTEEFSPAGSIPGTGIDIECDTVLFAVGLIPELESVKTAGVELPDRFKPAANVMFETNSKGLFAAGNCLHINDLADSAAIEGGKAADSVLKYMAEPEDFRRLLETSEDRLPYEEPAANRELNTEYFRRLEDEDLTVCIVCPKGCLLREGAYGCRRGEEYFRRTATPAGHYSQRIHTTVEINNEIIPAVSAGEIPVASARKVIESLKTEAGRAGKFKELIRVEANGSMYNFQLCRAVSESA